MKVTLKDKDNQDFEVGLDWFEDDSSDVFDQVRLFWIETEKETVTLRVDRRTLDQLAGAIQFMKGNV